MYVSLISRDARPVASDSSVVVAGGIVDDRPGPVNVYEAPAQVRKAVFH